MSSATLHAAIAAHRFGLGEPSLDRIGADAQGWLLAQVGPADPPHGAPLAASAQALKTHYEFQRRFIAAAQAAPQMESGQSPAPGSDARPVEQQFVEHFRALVDADTRSRLQTAAVTARPFTERLHRFWANHFTVSIAKASARGLAGCFEREAIRPQVAGRFETLLKAAVKHPAMLRYLDNELSAGPNSRVVARLARRPADGQQRGPRITGLNENLAREVLELHTLGAAAAREGTYTQADVTAFAAVLTGWRAPIGPILNGSLGADASPTRFDANWHEPGPKTVLGHVYRDGEQALDAVLAELARHPATLRFVSTKLARHFVADEPPAALVDRLVDSWRRSDGDLPAVYRALIESPEAWQAQPGKLKTPEEFGVSTARLLGLGARAFERSPDGGIATMGQRVQAAPSPAGWPDAAAEWLGPDAVWKRIEWTTRVSELVARGGIDARALAAASLGPLLGSDTRIQIERAADGAQALALLLLSPEFQRR